MVLRPSKAVLIAALALACVDRDPTHACSSDRAPFPCTRVLFIGNSYTFSNDLPAMFTALARSGGHDASTAMAAGGGTTLGAHVASPATARMIDSTRWDFVVIQEQSQIPSVEPSRSVAMYPAVRTLVGKVRKNRATPLLFVTWGRRDAWPERGLLDYKQMQAAIDSGYAAIASELNVALVPVGDAWAAVSREHPEIQLWQNDGSHPTIAGTYLAACAFYAAIFGQSPVGLMYNGSLSDSVARVLQQSAPARTFSRASNSIRPD